jgi:hypothetical protein
LRPTRNFHRLFAGLRGWLRVFRVMGHRFAGIISVWFRRVYLEKPAMLSSFRQFDRIASRRNEINLPESQPSIFPFWLLLILHYLKCGIIYSSTRC